MREAAHRRSGRGYVRVRGTSALHRLWVAELSCARAAYSMTPAISFGGLSPVPHGPLLAIWAGARSFFMDMPWAAQLPR